MGPSIPGARLEVPRLVLTLLEAASLDIFAQWVRRRWAWLPTFSLTSAPPRCSSWRVLAPALPLRGARVQKT
eukprot:4267084-Pyramimonas_sp.AAC.1